MNKSERKECEKLTAWGRAGMVDVATLARSFSALVRSARTTKSRNEIICSAGGFPAVVQHAEFIV